MVLGSSPPPEGGGSARLDPIVVDQEMVRFLLLRLLSFTLSVVLRSGGALEVDSDKVGESLEESEGVGGSVGNDEREGEDDGGSKPEDTELICVEYRMRRERGIIIYSESYFPSLAPIPQGCGCGYAS